MKQVNLSAGKHSIVFLLLLSIHCTLSGQGFSPAAQAKLQEVLDEFQNNPDNPYVGGIAAAIKVDGLAFWQGSTGYAARNVDAQNNLQPGGTAFTTATLSQIYSVTKTFTSALVLELANEGKLNLDDPVSNFLPLAQINAGLNASVTIRQLLAHESGYSDYTGEFQFQLAIAFQPQHIWTPFEILYFVHQVKQPGLDRTYSSTNYITLGAIVEIVTGKSLEQHYRERFFTPLQLGSMYLGVKEPQPAGTLLASPHDNISAFNPIFQLTGQPTFPNAYTNISRFPMTGIVSAAFAGGGIVSNIADLAEWGNALFSGRATSKATLDQMLNSISPVADDEGDKLGYGIWQSTKMSAEEKFIGHDGNAPGYRSVMFYQPDKKLTLVILTNYHGADIYALARALYAAVPEFTCGNDGRKDEKIRLCFNGNNVCVDRTAADELVARGGVLGNCPEVLTKAVKEVPAQESNSGFSISPNPVTTSSRIHFRVAERSRVVMKIYNLSGQAIATVADGIYAPGMHTINWNGRDNNQQYLPAGIYLCQLQNGNKVETKKISVVR
ncbi:serine hydrolase [Flavihumibacter sp. ZG627]|uniref:serine hydrolase n=1 Tax=Flavihumibacter sp. ZG627 TaxID=1463156 RepID=UPI00057D898C|nr:serine hydrolase [Flavihumibacter sp. ZG627]KIC92581.1 hypothetical protein HY58_03370 [Flavihumibacter sp. ZG627]